jgi:hypothetical protein
VIQIRLILLWPFLFEGRREVWKKMNVFAVACRCPLLHSPTISPRELGTLQDRRRGVGASPSRSRRWTVELLSQGQFHLVLISRVWSCSICIIVVVLLAGLFGRRLKGHWLLLPHVAMMWLAFLSILPFLSLFHSRILEFVRIGNLASPSSYRERPNLTFPWAFVKKSNHLCAFFLLPNRRLLISIDSSFFDFPRLRVVLLCAF